jgi:predicted dehydrogenase
MEDGSVFDYRGSWCANGQKTSWDSEWRVNCADGSVYWNGDEELLFTPTVGESYAILTQPTEFEGHAACIADMFDALGSGSRPSTDCRDNIHSIRMVYKAIESAKLGKKVLI